MGYATWGSMAVLCAVVSAKWALELNFNQLRQFGWGLVGLFLGPLGPLLLYVRLVRRSVGIKD